MNLLNIYIYHPHPFQIVYTCNIFFLLTDKYFSVGDVIKNQHSNGNLIPVEVIDSYEDFQFAIICTECIYNFFHFSIQDQIFLFLNHDIFIKMMRVIMSFILSWFINSCRRTTELFPIYLRYIQCIMSIFYILEIECDQWHFTT